MSPSFARTFVSAVVKDGELQPVLVQATGVILLVATAVDAFITGHVLSPILGAGGTLIGVGQYLGVIKDIKSLLQERGAEHEHHTEDE